MKVELAQSEINKWVNKENINRENINCNVRRFRVYRNNTKGAEDHSYNIYKCLWLVSI